MTSPVPAQEWRKEGYLISTNPSLLSLLAINTALGYESIYWAKPLPEADLKLMLHSSKCFGLYKISASPSTPSSSEELEQIGLARAITDNVTFAYLTDVYVLEEYQGKGLGTWLIKCVDEWLGSLEFLRRSMLITSGERTRRYYEREMGMRVFATRGKAVVMDKLGRGSVFSE